MKDIKSDQNIPLVQENIRLRNALAELSVLNDIATTINSTQPVEKIVDLIVKKCVKHLNVEQGAIMLLDEKDKEKPLYTMIREQHSSLNLLPYRLDAYLNGAVLKNQTPLLVNNLKRDKKFKDLIDADTPINSFLSVPLRVKNKMLGVLTVFNKISNEGFTLNDQRLLSIIATQSSQIIENARLLQEEQRYKLLQEEMRLARETQLNLLPKELPNIQNYQIAAKFIPAKEVGGDYYDVIKIDNENFAICLGDVSGKGLPAAMLMSNLQATLRSQTIIQKTCKSIIANSNNLLFYSTEPTRFATLFYGILNLNSNEITYCNAGHNYPFYISKEGNISELKIGGTMIGSFLEVPYDEEKILIDSGDMIVIYSDGITEAMNNNEDQYEEDKLKEIIIRNIETPPSELVEIIFNDVARFVDKAPQSDDISLMIIKRIA